MTFSVHTTLLLADNMYLEEVAEREALAVVSAAEFLRRRTESLSTMLST